MTDLSTAPVLSVRLHLPYDRPPAALAGNARAHWRAEARAKQETRNTVTVLARQAGLHRYRPGHVEHVTAQLVWAPGDRRKRDSDNLWRFAKVIFDCIARGRPDLVGLDVVPDDSPEHFTKLAPVILPPPAPKAMYLDLWLRFARPTDDSTEND